MNPQYSSNMKKPYQVPTATVVRLCLQNAILQGSNISIGGSTDRFDANRYDNDGESDWGEWNGREETLEE